MTPPPRRSLFDRAFGRTRRLAARKRANGLRPWAEGLEDRVVLLTIMWNTAAAPTGGDWDVGGNWVGGVAPNSMQNAVIDLTTAGTITHMQNDADSVLTLTTTNATIDMTAGSIAFGTGTSSIGSVTIGAGSSMSVEPGASVQLQGGQVLTDNGAMSFSTGDTMTLTGYYSTAQIIVDGTMTATGTMFTTTGNNTTSQLIVNSGGHLMASGNVFDFSQLYLNPGNVFNPGDLTNNAFNLPIYVTYNDVALLSGTGNNNQSFEQINIDPATLPSGQSLALNEIGTGSTANLSYAFQSGFTVASGATLSVGPNVSVLLQGGQVLTDNGAMSFSTGDTMTLTGYYSTAQIIVDGTMTATGTMFTTTGNNTTSQLIVNSGGHLMASGNVFDFSQLYLNPGNVFNPGDLTNNAFNLPIYVTYNDVALLSGTGNNNQSFEQINIDPATLPSGQSLALNEIGTGSTANLSYAFQSGFTVASGATLSVGPNVSVLLQGGQVLTDNGAMSFSTGDTMTLTGYYSTAQIIVDGTMTATGTMFTTTGNNTTSQLIVNSGGHLMASGNVFDFSQLYLNPGNVFNPGDLTNNAFNLPIYVTYNDVALLSGTGNNNQSFEQINIDPTTLPSGQSLALNEIGTGSTANLSYAFQSGFTVASGATLSVGPNVSVLLQGGQVLTDNGAMSFSTGDTMTLTGYYSTAQIIVDGTMTATGTMFTTTGNNTTSQLIVNSGGHLMASGNVFDFSQLYLNPGNVFNPGDLTNNAFNLPIYVTYNDVALLSGTGNNNQSFEQINIDPATLPSGQSLALNEIGTGSTANLSYAFQSGFTVASGATLSVGPNVSVLLQGGQVLTDNGAMSFSTGDTMTLTGYYSTAQIIVDGTMTATGTMFTTTGNNTTSQLIVNSGGHLMASGNVFDFSQLYLNPGNVFNPGDLTNNAFNLPIYVTYNDVALLSGTGNNNQSFEQINIDPTTLPSGQSLALNEIGTGSTANLSYAFQSGFTVASGATLSVGPNVSVLLQGGQVLTDNGAMSFSTGDTMTLTGYYSTAQIIVDGTMTATGTMFTTTGNNTTSQLIVNSGGHLMASGNVFDFSQLYLNPGNVFNPGDLTNNAFNLPIYVTYNDVALLSGTGNNNQSFEQINIDPATLPSGQSLALNEIGTGSTANLSYAFQSGFTVASGATLSVGPNVSVLLQGGQVLTDNGAMSFSTGDTMTLTGYYSTAQIIVDGTMTATGTMFTTTGNNTTSQLIVNSGGHLGSTGSTYEFSAFDLNSGSSESMSSNVLYNVTTINSNTTINIHGNDFSNVGAHGIVAVGDPNAMIDLTANFWGTSNSTQIIAKILDNRSDTTRPTVEFSPFTTAPPSAITGTVFNDINGDGVQDNGESGLGGILVYIDQNNSGSLVSTDPSTTTDTFGNFTFGGLAAGTYVVREEPANGTVETAPSATAVATTIDFDNVTAGTTNVSSGADSFSGGAVFAPSSGDLALLYSGTQAYNTSSTAGEVDFSVPVSSASFFYVHGFGYAAGTATAYSATGTVLGSVNSNAATTEGDPKNVVTMNYGQPIARILFVGGVVDHFISTTAANNQAYVVKLAAGQTSSVSFGNQTQPTSLEITSFTTTSTGFTVTFNEPLNQSVLNLYDSGGVYGAPDLTLVSNSTGATVAGSMLVSTDGMSVTFIKTGSILANDTYKLTLVSGPNAFVSTSGAALDGAGNGGTGSNYVTTFTVNNPTNAVVVSIPDFTRGYGQPVNVPASSTSGLPVMLSTGVNVSSVQLTLTYNPALLTFTDGAFSTPIAGASGVFHVVTPGTATLTVSSATQFSATTGSITLGYLTAVVPNNATYASKEILHISNLLVFDASQATLPLTAIGQDAIHIAAYFGDTYGGQKYTTQDVTLEQREIALVNSGFAAYRMADPVLLGDINSNGIIQSNDTTNIQRVIALQSVPNIPPLPTGLPTVATGPDPEIYIPNVQGAPGDTVSVPVYLKVTDPEGVSVSSFQVVIRFDTSLFTIGSTVTLGSAFTSLGSASIFTPTGLPDTIVVETSGGAGTGTLPYETNVVLFTLSFTVATNAPNGPSPINLLNDASNSIGDVQTSIFGNDANQTELTLDPAPTNNSHDPVDGIFGINTVELQSLAVMPPSPSVIQGQSVHFTVIGTYTDGSTADLTNQVTWASATASVATISNSTGTQGLATGVAQGTSEITASLGNVESLDDLLTVTPLNLVSIAISAPSTSAPKGTTLPFDAVGTYNDGSTADLTNLVTWASATTSVATISNASGSQGVATAISLGTSMITATLDGLQSAGFTLTVTPAVVVSIAVSGTNPSTPKGTTYSFTAQGTYSDGTTADITTQVAWASATTSVATISDAAGSQGVATGVAVGTSVITATLGSVVSPGDTLTVTPAVLVAVIVGPTSPTIAKGMTQGFTATGVYTDGTQVDLTTQATWSSSNTSVATISNTSGSQGVATGVSNGTTSITATFGTLQSLADTLTVTDAKLVSIAINPSNPSTPKGTTYPFDAVGTYSDGSTADLTTQVTWSSSVTSVATISNSSGTQGFASALTIGSTTITATLGSIASPGDTLTVTPAALIAIDETPINPSTPKGTTLAFDATGVYTDGTTADLTTEVTWESASPTIATVSNLSGSQGVATALAQGTAVITAELGSVVSAGDTLTVTPAVVVSIAVSPTNPSTPKGTTYSFDAVGTYTDGTTADITSQVTWASATTSVATISNANGSQGVATAVSVGTTVITATLGSVVSQGDTLTVSPAALVSILVGPTNPTIAKGSTQAFGATGVYTDGTTVDLTTQATWSSSNTSVATISNASGSQGVATGVADGTTLITASFGSIQSAGDTLTVTNAQLVSIAISPTNPSTPKGTTYPFDAVGTYTDGTMIDLTTQVTWSSSMTGVATISNSSGTQGFASALTVGSTVITATLGNIVSPGDTLTVTPAALIAIDETPINPSTPKGTTLAFDATGVYTDGSTADLTTEVTWESASPTIATVSNLSGSQGVATALAQGTAVITAELGSVVSAGDTLTVTAAALVSITVTPVGGTLPKGLIGQCIATGTYSDGSTADITDLVTWSSSDTGVATISNASGSWGEATGVGVGTTSITASLGGITSAGDTLTVTPAIVVSIGLSPTSPTCSKGSTAQFTATGTYSDGTTANLTQLVTWASDNTGVAMISNAAGSQGLATGVGVGTAGITATLNGVTSPSDPLTVTAASLQSIAVMPTSPTLAKGLTLSFTATGTYSDGTTANLSSQVTWASGTPSVATISPSGLATGVGVGTSGITATLNGVTSPSDPLTVTAASLQSIAVTPASPTLAKGLTLPFTATGTYSDGTTANLTPEVTWASDTPTVATISPSGLATAVGQGMAGITASLNGVTSPSDPLTVTAPSLQSIAVTPSNPSVMQGQTQQFTATGTYSDGTTANLTPLVTWASGSPAVATISPTGLASAVSPGMTPITATYGGVSSPADTLTVTPLTVSVMATSVSWGSESAVLVTASDGVRLLPVGRSTDLPWFGINRIAITLSQAATISPGDVSVTGLVGGNYGPVTISGSGTSYVITLAKAVSGPDRVTLTIGNAEVITYTRRLDILPGDVNDDGVVNTTDGVIILNSTTPTHSYNTFDDMNGDGAVSTADFTEYRPQIGTTLPGLPPQLVAGGEGPGAPAISSTMLVPVLDEAIAAWASAGLSARDVADLRTVNIELANLPAGYLGATAIHGTTIEISPNGSGYGWSIPSNGKTLTPGRVDLLTVVEHELGHTLGLGDIVGNDPTNDLMDATLAPGVRRLPSAHDLASVSVPAPSRATTSHPASNVSIDAVLGANDLKALLTPVPTEVKTQQVSRPEIIITHMNPHADGRRIFPRVKNRSIVDSSVAKIEAIDTSDFHRSLKPGKIS